jgi:drug/metabolite transporter (DMT)-like permease
MIDPIDSGRINRVGGTLFSTGESASSSNSAFSIAVRAERAVSRRTLGRLDNPLRGIGLIVISTMFMAASDVAAKYLTNSLPPIEVAWIRFLGFGLIMVCVLPRRRDLLRSRRPGLQLLRGLTLSTSSILFIGSLHYLPVAEATATSFVAPVFVTGLSIPLLRETVGLRRWMATLIGLVGVLIIVRPGTSAFQPASMLTIVSALAWAFTLIFTRKTSGSDSAATTLAYSATVGLCGLSMMVPFFWVRPSATAVLVGIFIALASTAGHWILVRAYRYADASVLAPFSYSQLLFATLFGFAIFRDVPGPWTFAGASVIVGSGLYTAHRERVRRDQAAAKRPLIRAG